MLLRVAVDDAIVEMIVSGGAERKVVEALEAEAFAEVLIEFVQRAQLIGERGEFLARRRAEEHLIAAMNEVRDFVADHDAGLADADIAAAAIFELGSAAVAHGDSLAAGVAADFETELLQFGGAG